MTLSRTFSQSFIGGEMSPEMLARFRDPRVQEGAARLRNMQVSPQGVAYKRPGRAFIAKGKVDGDAVRLITYAVTSSLSVAVELGHLYARFHAPTGTMLYCRGQTVSAVSTVNDTLAFAAPHGLPPDHLVRVVEPTGAGSVPTGVNEFTAYFTVVVDSHTIKLSTVAGGGAIVNITGAGSGLIRVQDSFSTPVVYSNPQVSISINTGTEVVTFPADHNIFTGDVVYLRDFSELSPITAVPPLADGQTFYARVVSSVAITLHTTLADALSGASPVNFTAAVNPLTFDLRKLYSQGDLVYWPGAGKGFYYCLQTTKDLPTPVSAPPSLATHWYRLPDTGEWEIPTPYDKSDTFELTYDQDGDRLLIAHSSYPPERLVFSSNRWTLTPVTFASSLPPPPGIFTGTVSRGQGIRIRLITAANPAVITTGDPLGGGLNSEHGLADGDIVFIFSPTVALLDTIPIPDFFRVRVLTPTTLELTNPTTGVKVSNLAGAGAPGALNIDMFPTLFASDTLHFYCVTTLDQDGRESTPSGTHQIANNLLADGAFNTVTWTAVPGAARYRVYKQLNGLFGLIGDVSAPATEFKDDNIEPDFTVTVPFADATFSGSTQPAAVAHYDQRAAYGFTSSLGATVLLTELGTDDSLTFHLPVVDTDRISMVTSNGRRNEVRHLVGFGHLLVLTDVMELRVTPLNSDALTPSSASVRPQSAVGANYVRPLQINSTMVFAGARGGHVYEVGFRQEAGGFITNDLCFRTTHLFDGFEVLDAARTTSPQPLLWFVSSAGKLLGLTYVPEEQVGAWHQHDTDGVVESCACVSDGSDERLMVAVRRVVNGTTVRHIECSTLERATADDAVYVDGALTYVGQNVFTITVDVTLTGGFSWAPGEVLFATTTYPMLRIGTADAGVVLVVRAAGLEQRVVVREVLSTTSMLVEPVDSTVPAGLRNVATTDWAVLRSSFVAADHLEGKTVRGLADGEPFTATVSGGAFSIPAPAQTVVVGLGYTAELVTVPVIAQADAAAQGVTKGVNMVSLRVGDSVDFEVGSTKSPAVPVRSTDIEDGVVRVVPNGNWSELGQVAVRQDSPVPLSIFAVMLEVSIGG